jgi:hypothetical protein
VAQAGMEGGQFWIRCNLRLHFRGFVSGQLAHQQRRDLDF